MSFSVISVLQVVESVALLNKMSKNVMSFVSDIEDLPPAVQEKLFDEVLDRDVQKGEMLSLSFMTL